MNQTEPEMGGCTFAGPGRGDCEHFIGLPGKSIPGLHDGPDDTVDVYGKPNGWCWSCWKSHQIRNLRADLANVRSERQQYKELWQKEEAKCAEMRKALWFIRDECDWQNIMDDGGDDRIGPACDKALSSDCGKGWRSPEDYAALEAKWAKAVADMNAIDGCWEKKYESLEAQCAEMRKIIPELWRCANDDCDLSQAQIDHVLSSDCGKNRNEV